MTNEASNEAGSEQSALIARIFDLALNLTADRLENVDPKERKDNVAFDRVARTAQAFLRVADEAHALSARQQKEDAAHDEGANVRLPDATEIDALERALNEIVARQDRGHERRGAECDRSEPGAAPVVDRGGIA